MKKTTKIKQSYGLGEELSKQMFDPMIEWLIKQTEWYEWDKEELRRRELAEEYAEDEDEEEFGEWIKREEEIHWEEWLEQDWLEQDNYPDAIAEMILRREHE